MSSRFILFLLPIFVLTACVEKDSVTGAMNPDSDVPVQSHGMIVLGKRLDNPYTTANMRKACEALYGVSRSDDVPQVETTHLYVRFLPQDSRDFEFLRKRGIVLFDHPLDYEIVSDGDYYHDPDLPDDVPTWQYAVVDKDFMFTSRIRHEIIDECFIPDESAGVKSSGVDWSAIEREAFRLTGNDAGDDTRGPACAPQGRITVSDGAYDGGAKYGVSGAMVVCNVFVKIAKTYTDAQGYYAMGKTFRFKPHYRIVFDNERGFAIGFNFIIVPASVTGLGKHSQQGADFHFTQGGDPKTWRRSIVNNAVYDYIGYCSSDDISLTPPPSGYRIWMMDSLGDSYTLMMHHGAIWQQSFLVKCFPEILPVLNLLSPDVVIGIKNFRSAADLYGYAFREAANASHYTVVGNGYWNMYAASIISNALKGKGRYGDGSMELDGYTGVSEMWACYVASLLMERRYGIETVMGEDLWFRPGFLKDLSECGIGVNAIFAVLGEDVNSIQDLGMALCGAYPDKASQIETLYESYFGPMTRTEPGIDSDANTIENVDGKLYIDIPRLKR